MKYRNRVLGILFIIGTLALILATLVLNSTQPTVNAGVADPTKAAYLPFVVKAGTLFTPTALPTATPTASPTVTPNPNDFTAVEFDDLSPEVPVVQLLAAQQAHLWPILFEYNGVITITAVSEPSVNLVIEIINPTNNVLHQANNGGSGELEAIINSQLDIALDYKIRVYDLNGSEGNYCLIFSENGGFPDMIKGRIDYGQSKTNETEFLGIDYYCFMGANGDNVSISVSATGITGDFVLALLGPPDLETIGNVFTSSEITNAMLEEDGIYIIAVLNLDADAAGYSLTLNKN
ncbi:hypothetical protein MNBD_CHLOROFLEXI01-3645 [hydrothermal vent metagenome]|uniref:Peptidase C-terminal archaeal/bacterial domain-containing protein n=1 Tax=hydrothermal vent metagenome TaxID=652676 RepID=A0A3B0VIK2_9ZZZZ